MKLREAVRKLVCAVLAAATVAVFSVTAFAATNYKTGCFAGGDSYTSVHYIYAEAQKHTSNGKTYYTPKTPKLTIKSYRGDNVEKTETTMYVQIKRADYDQNKWNPFYDYSWYSGKRITLTLNGTYGKRKYASPKDVRQYNRWKVRIKRVSKNTDVRFWSMKVENGSF